MPTLTVGTVQITAVCDVTGDFPARWSGPFPGWRRPPGRRGGGATRRRSAGPAAGGCATGASWSGAATGSCWSTPGSAGPGCPAPPGSGPRDGCRRSWPRPGSSRTRSIWSSSPTCTWTTSAGTWPGTATGPGRCSRGPATWSSGPTGSCSRAEGDEDAREAFDRCAAPLQALGVAELLEGDRTLDAELSLLHTPGHTPGSQSLLVRSGERRGRCSGATSPTTRPRSASPTGAPAATSSPRWPAGPGAGSWTSSRPRACGWPRPISRSRSAP